MKSRIVERLSPLACRLAAVLALSWGVGDQAVLGQAVGTGDRPEIVFTSTRDGNWELYGMRADGSNVRRLTRNSGVHTPSDGWPKWSPTGDRIAFMSDTERHGVFSIYTMDPTGRGLQRLTAEPAGRNDDAEYPTWSPDGTQIAYFTPSAGLYVMRSDGSEKRLLARLRTCDCPLAWSPDGGAILFATDQGKDGGLHLYDIANGTTTLIKALTGSYHRAEWSPDGARIAVVSDVDCSRGAMVRVMKADGSGLTVLAEDAGRGGVSWSPDGERLVFSSTRDGDLDLFVVGLDGSNPINLTRRRGSDFDPDWSPRATSSSTKD